MPKKRGGQPRKVNTTALAAGLEFNRAIAAQPRGQGRLKFHPSLGSWHLTEPAQIRNAMKLEAKNKRIATIEKIGDKKVGGRVFIRENKPLRYGACGSAKGSHAVRFLLHGSKDYNSDILPRCYNVHTGHRR